MTPKSKIIQPIANGATGAAPLVTATIPYASGDPVNPVLTTEVYDPVSEQGLDALLNDINAGAQAQAAQIAGIQAALPNKLEMVQAWVNASPASAFPPQIVPVDLQGAIFAYVRLRYSTAVDLADRGAFAFIPTNPFNVKYPVHVDTNTFNYRQIYITSAGIGFLEGYSVTSYNGAPSTNNNLAIPGEIYILKGVQS